MRKIVWVFIVLALSVTYVGLNLGKWLDVTEEPVKSDIIVCLGGGTIERVKKSIKLYKEGYSIQNKFILLGESWYNQPYITKNHPDVSVEIYECPKNTKAEIEFIKNYMKKKGYKTALVVTDPPHSGRARILISLVSIDGDEAMEFHMIGSDVAWWDAAYYKNERSVGAVLHESMGILYAFVMYGILEKIGFLNGPVDSFEEWREK